MPLKRAANGPNSAISLTQTFDRILFCVYNSLYFGVQKAKNGDRGTIVFTATLRNKELILAPLLERRKEGREEAEEGRKEGKKEVTQGGV